jgi:hypothetical protein
MYPAGRDGATADGLPTRTTVASACARTRVRTLASAGVAGYWRGP